MLSADDCRCPFYRFLTASTWDAALPSITHILGSPLGCKLLKGLKARLEDVEDDFDDTWVASTASFAKRTPDMIVPPLPNGESSGLESRGAAGRSARWTPEIVEVLFALICLLVALIAGTCDQM